MTSKRPAAPAGLSARSRKLWAAVLVEFEFSPAEVELFRSALIALDRADAAAEIIVAEGVTAVDRYGSPKQHPAVDVELRNRTLYARLVQQLGIRAEDDSPVSPITLKARKAANARWGRRAG